MLVLCLVAEKYMKRKNETVIGSDIISIWDLRQEIYLIELGIFPFFFMVDKCVICVLKYLNEQLNFAAQRRAERERGLERVEIDSGRALDWDLRHPEMQLKV